VTDNTPWAKRTAPRFRPTATSERRRSREGFGAEEIRRGDQIGWREDEGALPRIGRVGAEIADERDGYE